MPFTRKYEMKVRIMQLTSQKIHSCNFHRICSKINNLNSTLKLEILYCSSVQRLKLNVKQGSFPTLLYLSSQMMMRESF